MNVPPTVGLLPTSNTALPSNNYNSNNNNTTTTTTTVQNGGGGGGGEFIAEYSGELSELTFNSKPLINSLTIVAGENSNAAADIVNLIHTRIKLVDPDKKLPLLYLMDSICKNIGGAYVVLFSNVLVDMFADTFNRVASNIRNSMIHLLKTWNGLFPADKLQQIEAITQGTTLVHQIPTNERKSTSIHVNPKFVQPPQGRGRPQPQPKQPDRLDDILSSQNRTNALQEQYHQRRTQPIVHRNTASQGLLPDPVPIVPSVIQQPLQVAPDVLAVLQLQAQQQTTQVVTEVTQLLKMQQLPVQDQYHLLELLQRVQQFQQQPPSLASLQLQFQTIQLITNILRSQQPNQLISVQPNPSDFSIAPNLMPQLSPYPQPQNQFGLPHIPDYGINGTAAVPPGVSTVPFNTTEILSNLSSLGFMKQPAPPVQPPIMYQLPVPVPTPVMPAPSMGPAPLPKPNVPPPPRPLFSNPLANKDPFSPEVLKSRQDSVINGLYFQFPLQCKNCGLRFFDRDKLDKHLDWHFLQNRKERERTKKAMSRSWYRTKEDWVTDADVVENAVTPFFGETGKPEKEDKPVTAAVPADEQQTHCLRCSEPFELFYDREQDEWMYKDAVIVEGSIYHQKCVHTEPPQPPEPNDSSTVGIKREGPDEVEDDTALKRSRAL